MLPMKLRAFCRHTYLSHSEHLINALAPYSPKHKSSMLRTQENLTKNVPNGVLKLLKALKIMLENRQLESYHTTRQSSFVEFQTRLDQKQTNQAIHQSNAVIQS